MKPETFWTIKFLNTVTCQLIDQFQRFNDNKVLGVPAFLLQDLSAVCY